MEFPVLFLGAKPQDTPSLYSLMNYAGLKLGTFYPMGGFYSLVKAMKEVCLEGNVQFHTNTPIKRIIVEDGYATSLEWGKRPNRGGGKSDF